jgi:hypothetical protein
MTDKSKRPAKLALKRESLRTLSPQALREVGGGEVQSVIPTKCTCTGFYPSLNAPCTVDGSC